MAPHALPPAAEQAGTRLVVDLDALVHNWRWLRDHRCAPRGTECGAVVKADAYGLGIAAVAPALWRAGARTFFVAHGFEGERLRALLGPEAVIYVLHGPLVPVTPAHAALFRDHALIPVLNAPEQVTVWQALARDTGATLPCALHLDTGMNRLGLDPAQAAAVARDPAGLEVRLLLTHFACADEPDHPLNGQQLARFAARPEVCRPWSTSLCNSSGLFLPGLAPEAVARPGIALYGGNPTPGDANLMRPVVRLEARVLQVRDVDTPGTVGYGASWQAPGPRRLATVAVGYADGWFRCLGNRGAAVVEGLRLPLVGRVSMDLTVLDVTDLPRVQPGDTLPLLSPDMPIDTVAEAAGTIGYEILTSLGPRYARHYVGGGAS